MSYDETCLHVGAAVTMRQLETSLNNLLHKLPGIDSSLYRHEYCLSCSGPVWAPRL